MKCFLNSVKHYGTAPILFAIILMTTMSVLTFLLDDLQSFVVYLVITLMASAYLVTIYKDYKTFCKDQL